MEIISIFHYHIDIQYYLGQGILASFFQKGFQPMIKKSLPDTIVERVAKITDAALLRQGRVRFLFYQVPLIPGESFSSFVDAVITAFTREGLSPRYLWFRTSNAIYLGLWLSEIFRRDFTPLFARIDSLWTHYSFSRQLQHGHQLLPE